ncbi:thiopeptide-type bacteriocin biosynthesis protein [Chitinophaga dinghuensis]|uniref:Thiopeptide-type bacteriocin biosynthesis protein n=1 Tax=Chitinophaga dinghuensis TaxID=1539050 RepID=A0A327WD51_9BACT|nr:lantibiotic dehydratase [Chitinophaga dinghuensis]RAJ87406.1 thiopeptide-type bacteriocin biosynthesis protein [Chitinophaga dinghuensis]
MHDRFLMPQVKSFDFYLLRLPLLPYNTVKFLHAGNNRDVASLTATIKSLYLQPTLQEAIYLASPELHHALMDWLNGANDLRPAKQHKLVITLYKYLLRMCARSTPYGLFAGCAAGSITDNATEIVMSEDAYQRKARLDIQCLSAIADELIRDEEIANMLTFLPNSSIYRAGNTYRYYEYQIKENKRHYFLSSFSHNIYLEKILSIARNGATIQQLTAVLMDLSITADEAKSFISMLMENQILVSAFHPTLSGPDYLSTLVAKLNERDIKSPLRQLLSDAHHHLVAYENNGKSFNVIGELLQKVCPGMLSKDLVLTDLFHATTANQLNRRVVDRITAAISQLSVLNIGAPSVELTEFQQKFQQRYENRAIPLLTALDSENGIGYGLITGDKSSYTPIVDDLQLPSAPSISPNTWSSYHKLVLKKFIAAQQLHAKEIVLTTEDLEAIQTVSLPELPPTTTVLGTLLTPSAEKLDEGDFRFVLKSCGGSSALPLLARFGASNPALAAEMEKVAALEKNLFPDAIFAEIIHLPEGRTGNVLLRPKLFDYEIPFLGNASVDKEFQIPVSDLYVKVVNNRVVLFSQSLNKEVKPRLTSAHNYNNSLPIYKFLGDLQHQDYDMALMWDWNILQEQHFLPRVRFKEIILSRARWNLSATDFQRRESQGDTVALQEMLHQYQVPNQVLMVETDNELFLDLTCSMAQELLLQHLKKGDVILYESLMEDEQLFIRNNKGYFCNEVIFPLYNTQFKPRPSAIIPKKEKQVERTFNLGSEWLYAKIYCGPKSMDKLLTTAVFPIVNHLKMEGLADSWFFVRYQDPENHLRLRLHLTDPDQTQAVIQEINQALHDYTTNEIVYKIQFDTYSRELERYGPENILHCENLFHLDSELILELLPHIQSGNQEFYRWIFAVKATDILLTNFGLTLQQKIDTLSAVRDGLFQEFHGNNNLQFQLNNKYREYQDAINGILSASARSFPLADVIYDLFGQYQHNSQDSCTELRIACSDAVSQQQKRLQQLTSDLIHMMMNRFFVANQRLHELVVYHCLVKHYTGVLAKEKTSFHLRNILI